MTNQIRSLQKPSELHQKHGSGERRYVNFALMVICSTVAMFGVSYVGSASLEHVVFSQTQAYMTIAMGASMALVMWAFMQDMLNRKRTNIILVVASLITFGLSVWLLRSHLTIGDVAFMEAMIPHHSMAILSAGRANISDPRVRDLANRILRSQTSEIAEMKSLIRDLKKTD